MSDDTNKPSTPKRGGWLRKLAWVAGIFVLLLVIGYFVVTSGGFVKSVILPKVGTALNADLTAGDVELSPFSQLVLRDLKLTPKGKDTLLTASLVRARYRLFDIIGGKINVDEVTVESPTVTLVRNADGTSNLDPLTQGQKASPPPATSKSSAPPQVDIKTVALKNATVKITQQLPGGGSQVVQLSDVNLTAANIKNGASGKLDLGALIALDQTGASAANLGAKLNGDFTFDLTSDLMPAKLAGKLGLNVDKASGAYGEVAGLGINLDADASPTEIKQVALRFTRGAQALGEVRVNGPFDMAKMEGKVNVAVLALDKNVLNLAGAASGVDFGSTVVNSTNVIELSKAGAMIAASGQLTAAKVSITKDKQTTPTLDFRADYAVTVDNAAQSAQIRTLNFTGTQNARPFLQTELTSPMTIAWGTANNAVGDATMNLTLTALNLADWRAFAADLSPAGLVNLKVKLTSQQAGKKLAFDVDGGVTGLSAKFGSNALNQADVTLRVRGTGTDLKQFKLDEYRAELAQGGQSAVTISGAGTVDTATQDADLQVLLQTSLTRVLAMFPQPDAKFTGGTVDLKGQLTSKAQTKSVTGKLTLAGLTGSYTTYRFADFGSAVDLDVGMVDTKMTIRRASGELHEGAKAGGSFGATGNLDTATKAGQFMLALTNLNQNGLRPFIEGALGDKKLVSVALNTTATANLAANGDADVKASLQVTNLVVNDAKNSLPATPLELKLQVDAGVAKNVASIRQGQLTLTPTARAKNELNLTGSVDYSKTNAITGKIKLAAESLDVTSYYDLVDGGTKPAAAPTTTPAPSSGMPEKEPDPIALPVQNLVLEASIGKFYLREVEATNFLFTTTLDRSRVLVKPAQLVLNGAPLSATADLDLSVPGYKYDVAFNADKIPMEPLVNSFSPKNKGNIHGVTLGSGQLKGAGITGPNLKKNLNGQFSFATTNLALSISNIRNPILFTLINTISALPELISNPSATFGNLLTNLRGQSANGAFADEITAHPLETISVKAQVANGKLTLSQASVQSAVLAISADGGVLTLDDVLTNSPINFPVKVTLARSLAEKVKLANNIPTNQVMVDLPDFFAMKGTVGNPQRDINKAAVAALVGKMALGIAGGTAGNLGDKISDTFNKLGNALNQNAQTNATTGTNTPASRPNPVGGLIQGLFGNQNTHPTNHPATNIPAKPK